MTYPLIGNYGICYEDMESDRPWLDAFIVRELSRIPSNFRSEDTIQNFLLKYDILVSQGLTQEFYQDSPRERHMNGCVNTDEHYQIDDIPLPKLGKSIYDRKSG